MLDKVYHFEDEKFLEAVSSVESSREQDERDSCTLAVLEWINDEYFPFPPPFAQQVLAVALERICRTEESKQGRLWAAYLEAQRQQVIGYFVCVESSELLGRSPYARLVKQWGTVTEDPEFAEQRADHERQLAELTTRFDDAVMDASPTVETSVGRYDREAVLESIADEDARRLLEECLDPDHLSAMRCVTCLEGLNELRWSNTIRDQGDSFLKDGAWAILEDAQRALHARIQNLIESYYTQNKDAKEYLGLPLRTSDLVLRTNKLEAILREVEDED